MYDNFTVIDFDWKAKFKETQQIAQGMDFGFTFDPTTLISTVVDLKNKELWIYDEHSEKGMVSDDIYKMIVKKGYKMAHIVADSAEKRLITEINRKGVPNLRPSVKGPNTIMQGVQFIQGFKIYIHPTCEHTIEEFNTYTFDQDTDGNWLNKPIDKNNHLMDALRYSLENYHIKRKQRKKQTGKSIKNIKSMGL